MLKPYKKQKNIHKALQSLTINMY